MTRLDRHVRSARNKLTLGLFSQRLASCLLSVAAAAWIAIVVFRLIGQQTPGAWWWLAAAVVAAFAGAAVLVAMHRPSPMDAAVEIDARLDLKETYSTALFARGLSDPFARAAAANAEKTADSAKLAGKFPLAFPRRGYAAIAVALLAACTAWWMPRCDVLGIQAHRQHAAVESTKHRNAAVANARQAMMQLESAPADIANAREVRQAREALRHLLENPAADPAALQRQVALAMQKLQEAQQQRAAAVGLDRRQLATIEAGLKAPGDGKGPVADAHRLLAEGKLDAAGQALNRAVANFPGMSPREQQLASQQMSTLAKQLQQQANNPQPGQNIQQGLQKLGATTQQANHLANQMQQSAQGNSQAGQQVQQMSNQLIQQANAGSSSASQKQQQQNAVAIRQSIGQLQQQANSQAAAKQLAQRAGQLASAMQQSGSSGQKGGTQVASAGQQMQQALQQLQAGAGASAANGSNQQNGNGGSIAQSSQNSGPSWGTARFGLQTRNIGPALTHTDKPQLSPSQADPAGRVLASSLVKDNAPITGQSQQTLAKVAESAQQDDTEEVDQDRVPRSAQTAVKEYFQTLTQDGQKQQQ